MAAPLLTLFLTAACAAAAAARNTSAAFLQKNSAAATSKSTGVAATSGLNIGGSIDEDANSVGNFFEPSPLNRSSSILLDALASRTYGCSTTPYRGPNVGAASCFCHRAGNPSCRSVPCSCSEGCTGNLAENSQTVSFRNWAGTSCRGAILTIPKAYHRDISSLKRDCGGGSQALLGQMLLDGFNAYQGVMPGPVMQCVHKAASVSVPWLHLHTFCEDGEVDGMPNRAVAYCAVMSSAAEAWSIAAKFSSWSR